MRALTLLPVALCATAGALAAQATTHRFDLPTAPLSIFGVRFTADHLGPPMGTIVDARLDVTFTTESFDAADLVLELQAPSAGLPTWRVRGAALGWSGTGTFQARLRSSSLNGPIDLGYPLPTASLFGVTIATEPFGPLGGQLVASHYEVDVIPWTDLGGGFAGGTPPRLVGSGALTGGASVALSLGGAHSGVVAALILGAPRVDWKLFGGTLVPAPQVAVPTVVTPAGTVDLSFVWPAGVPSGATLFAQFWYLHGSSPTGVVASNGVGAVTP